MEIDPMRSAHRAEESTDNYAVFMDRLENAVVTLREKRALVDLAAPLVAELYRENQVGHQGWVDRRREVEAAIDEYRGDTTGYELLADLLRDATTLERTFEERTRRLEGKRRMIEDRHKDLDASLMELEQSKAKLDLSRMLTQDRSALSRTMSQDRSVMGTAVTGGIDAELESAREAVFLAEALVEVKGHHAQ
ncbi:hypothetical protein [Arthrobacter antioxidans]|uniref:hypothetical protein n=1 Tax=Arthrobacter antioxidans TaxID=2895818 RepID=UPI001FFEF673|nr:hypothetical protein [Arthrobacter antioxidans]